MKPVKNYWIITTEFPPTSGGGISTYCFETAEMFKQSSYNVSIFTIDYKEKWFKVQHIEGYRIIKFNPYYHCPFEKQNPASLAFGFLQIVEYFIKNEGKPAYIESQDYLGIAYYIQQKKNLYYDQFQGIPIVITIHAPAFLYYQANKVDSYRFPEFLTCEMERNSIFMADILIAPSKYIYNALPDSIKTHHKNVHFIPNPYKISHTPPLKMENYPVQTNNEAVFYGKLTAQKGILELLTYIDDGYKKGVAINLNIIGESKIYYHLLGRTMDKLIKQKWPHLFREKKIRLSGKINKADLNKFIKNSTFVVFPSLIDNLPYAIIEAMGNGAIVLSSVQGGQSEIINHGECGFLFDHNVKDDFLNNVKKIQALSQHERNNISNAAITRIQQEYSYEVILKKKIEAIESYNIETSVNFPFIHQERPATQKVSSANYKKKSISVIIPYYNMGSYIQDALSSLFRSTIIPDEILIINDGSTSKQSIDILKQLSKHSLISVIHQENKGLSSARNTGIKAAQSEYIAFLDADDTYEPEYIEKSIDVLSKSLNVFYVGCWVKYFGAKKHRWLTFSPQPPFILTHNSINSSSLICKRELFDTLAYDEQFKHGFEDYEFVLSMYASGYNGIVLPECLFNYRVRKKSMFRSMNTSMINEAYSKIFNKYEHLYKKHSLEVMQLLNSNGPGRYYETPGNPIALSVSRFNIRNIRSKLDSQIKKYPIIRTILFTLTNK